MTGLNNIQYISGIDSGKVKIIVLKKKLIQLISSYGTVHLVSYPGGHYIELQTLFIISTSLVLSYVIVVCVLQLYQINISCKPTRVSFVMVSIFAIICFNKSVLCFSTNTGPPTLLGLVYIYIWGVDFNFQYSSPHVYWCDSPHNLCIVSHLNGEQDITFDGWVD